MTIISNLSTLLRALASWRRGRQGYARLCGLDDRALSDLGLTRSDLRDATATGFFGDPTTIVATRADERSGHRRPAVIGHDNEPPTAIGRSLKISTAAAGPFRRS